MITSDQRSPKNLEGDTGQPELLLQEIERSSTRGMEMSALLRIATSTSGLSGTYRQDYRLESRYPSEARRSSWRFGQIGLSVENRQGTPVTLRPAHAASSVLEVGWFAASVANRSHILFHSERRPDSRCHPAISAAMRIDGNTRTAICGLGA